jgi:hypothetical protein
MSQKSKLLEISDPSVDINSLQTTANIVVCDNMTAANVLSLYTARNVRHIVQKSNLLPECEIKAANVMLDDPAKFLAFPLSTIFGHPQPDDKTEKDHTQLAFRVSEADQKSDLLDAVEKHVSNISSPKSLAIDVRAVGDELITNAIYNAPFVDRENSFSGPTRDKAKVLIDPKKRPLVFIGTNEERVVFGCRDFYGRLNVKKIAARIQLCYQNNPSQLINYGPGGAGIGSYMVFDSCVSMYIAVEANKSTTICCVFPTHMSARKRHILPKNLHIHF